MLQDEDLLVLRLPEGLQGDIMLEAVRINCQRTGYLEYFSGRRAGALCGEAGYGESRHSWWQESWAPRASEAASLNRLHPL